MKKLQIPRDAYLKYLMCSMQFICPTNRFQQNLYEPDKRTTCNLYMCSHAYHFSDDNDGNNSLKNSIYLIKCPTLNNHPPCRLRYS